MPALNKLVFPQIRVAIQCLRAGQHVCDAGVEEIKISWPIEGGAAVVAEFPYGNSIVDYQDN